MTHHGSFPWNFAQHNDDAHTHQELSHRSRLTVMAGSQKKGSAEDGARSESLYVLRQNGSTTASTCASRKRRANLSGIGPVAPPPHVPWSLPPLPPPASFLLPLLLPELLESLKMRRSSCKIGQDGRTVGTMSGTTPLQFMFDLLMVIKTHHASCLGIFIRQQSLSPNTCALGTKHVGRYP